MPGPTHESRLLARLAALVADPALKGLSIDEVADVLRGARRAPPPSDGAEAKHPSRWQDELILRRIPQGASVLDLGCGGGELLARLIRDKQVQGQGIELESEACFQCVEKRVPVLQSDLDAGLKGFADLSFDYVVLEETLQTLRHPTDLLEEMLRVGRLGIVSFPNFGYWRVRVGLGLGGRMPVTQRLPYRWHDTPNIHLFTLQDFLDWCGQDHARIVEGHALCEGEVRAMEPADNLYAEEMLIVVEKAKR